MDVHKNAIVITPQDVQGWIEDLIPDNWSKTGGHWLIQHKDYRETVLNVAYEATRKYTKEVLDNEEG